jgi:hypothetical protein
MSALASLTHAVTNTSTNTITGEDSSGNSLKTTGGISASGITLTTATFNCLQAAPSPLVEHTQYILCTDSQTYSVQNGAAVKLSTSTGGAAPVVNQNVVTGSRALDTVFQNTTGKVMFVAVTVNGGANHAVASAYTDSNATPSTPVGLFSYSAINNIVASGFGQLFFIVLPGNYYKVTNDLSMSLGYWVEWN